MALGLCFVWDLFTVSSFLVVKYFYGVDLRRLRLKYSGGGGGYEAASPLSGSSMVSSPHQEIDSPGETTPRGGSPDFENFIDFGARADQIASPMLKSHDLSDLATEQIK